MLETARYGRVLRIRAARTILGRGWYHSAAYRVGPVLIDAGCPHTASEMGAILGREGEAVRLVLNTHHHEDHVGADAVLQRVHSARVMAPLLALDRLRSPPPWWHYSPYRLIFWGLPEPCRPEPLPAVVEEGGLRLRVVPTPGHSRDHVVFFEEQEGWLFGGDAFVGGQDRGLRPTSDIYGIIASLRVMLGLGAQRLFSGSGSVYADPGAAIRNKIAYLEDLGDRVRELGARGLGAKRIARRLFWPPSAMALVTGGDFSADNLVRAYLAGPSHPRP